MNYHVHPSPKPITFFSLYTTKKPKKPNYIMAIDKHHRVEMNSFERKQIDIIYERNLAEHLASHYVYLQEPEFKVGDEVFYLNNMDEPVPYVLQKGDFADTEDANWVFKDKIFSYYYLGQKIDPSKVSYVREVAQEQIFSFSELYGPFTCENSECKNESWKILLSPDQYKQKSNMERADVCAVIIRDRLGIAYCDEHLPEWKPAPEPVKPTLGMSQMGGHDNDIEYEPDDELYKRLDEWQKNHAQWLTDLSEGTVQTTVNKAS